MRNVLAVLLVVAAMSVKAQPVEFKGVPMGASVDEVRVSVLDANAYACKGDEAGSQTCAISGITYANQKIEWALARFNKGRLVSVTIALQAPQFEPVVAALRDKYGPPKIDRKSSGRNAYNASFPQRELGWFPRDGGSILATSQTEKVNEATILLMSAESAALNAEEAAKRPAPKKDL